MTADSRSSEPRQARRIASDTRQWTSGVVRFAVIGVEAHPERSYVKFEKDLIGVPFDRGGVQRFNLNLRDWNNLKRLVETELAEHHRWVIEGAGLHVLAPASTDLVRFLETNPGLVEKILDLQNLATLSKESFEALNRLALKVYAVQGRHLDTILEKLSSASEHEFVQFAALLRDMRLGQVATLATLIRQKLAIISLFRTLTSAQDTREGAIHEVIENNIWIANKRYEIVASDETLARYLAENAAVDPDLKKRPDLIVKRVPYEQRVVVIELKRPDIQLHARHIGQVLEYRDIIQQYRPNLQGIDCYLFGYAKSKGFSGSRDVTIRTYSELVTELEDEYREYLRVLDETDAGGADADEIPF
jgi:hypothetical protein